MPRGRPRLPAEVKQEHVLHSRKQYEEKWVLNNLLVLYNCTNGIFLDRNVEKQREAAHLRMQCKRAKIEDDLRLKYAYRHKAAQASARYQRRKNEREWAEYKDMHDAKRRALMDKGDNVRQATMLQDQEAAEVITTAAPRKKKARVFCASPSPRKELRSSLPPCSVPRTACHIMPLPLANSPRRLMDITQKNNDSDSKSEGGRARFSLPPVFEHRVVRDSWMDSCIPTYEPDPGHEDRDVHDDAPHKFYYVIVSKYWSGVVSSSEAIECELKRDPNAHTFIAPTWRAAMDWWSKDSLLLLPYTTANVNVDVYQSHATLSAHAARNPSKPVQPPRQCARKSDAGVSTQAVNDAKLKNEEMFAEVDAFQELRHEKVKELAIKYEKDEAFFLKLLTHGGRYSGMRGTTLWNTFKHDLSRQARESGESKSTIELNEEAKEKYEEFKKSLTEDEKKEFIAQLEDHHELQHKGMRDMYEHIGVHCLAFFTRGNPNNPSLPHIEDSGGSRWFCIEALEMDEYDFVHASERWACQQDAGGPKQNHKLTVIQKEVSEMLNGGLSILLSFFSDRDFAYELSFCIGKVKNNDSLSMEYVNYRVDIVHKLGVELAGWPARVEMALASKLSAENARDIHQKLKSGAIHWVALTRSQRDAVAEEIEEQRAQGPLKPTQAAFGQGHGAREDQQKKIFPA
ncbi:hypothetical protein C8R45DRAFT_1223760 [Mycena sanguinolenta]|nr:hypothetical protein C8R45DRAFT_1223760 [Mycena sanguinolenta]